MGTRAVIPFKPDNPKTRLAPVLDPAERSAFARAMLDDVVDAVRRAGAEPVILATQPISHPGAVVDVREGGLNDVLNDLFGQSSGPVLVIMADLPLATPASIQEMLSSTGDVALAPGRGGGTNAVWVRDPPRFRADFYGASFLDHLRIARERGLETVVIDSFLLSTDIDEPGDLVEVLIHGTGKSRSMLETSGFALAVTKGRVGIERHSHEEAL